MTKSANGRMGEMKNSGGKSGKIRGKNTSNNRKLKRESQPRTKNQFREGEDSIKSITADGFPRPLI